MKCTKVVEAFVLVVKRTCGSKGLVSLFLMAVVVLSLGGATQTVRAAEFSEAELFFELNNTDGDLGIHASIDGGPYTMLEIDDSKGRTILLTTASGRLAKQGLTQYFFESAEPSFDELAPEEFFSRFPEGVYEIEAKGLAGERFEATVELSHVLAAPVGNITVNGVDAAEDCDDVLNLPVVSDPVTIDWDPVVESHPEIGTPGEMIEIVRYQFFVEQGDVKFAVDLPTDPVEVTQFMVPSEIISQGGVFKFEIIARTETGNNTAIENCFIVQ
jgi:hypothetical protein